MGRKEKQKAKKIEHEDKNMASTLLMAVSSDDEEANEDLSLKIVEKALLMRASKLLPNDDVRDGGGDIGSIDIASSSQQPELVSVRYDDVLNGPRGVGASEVVNVDNEEEVETEGKINKAESGDPSVVIDEEQETVETIKATEKNDSAEASMVRMSDNIVLRKLLRGPRYFDPPDSGWGTCFNCGEGGHTAINCTAAKRKKPCFICGISGHNAKQCTMVKDCFICKKDGHRAKDCPEKHKGGSKSSAICLKCGNFGHEMFSCKDEYLLDDLKEIQCYVCKRFGHLCCINTDDATPTEISCYKCGQLGHAGLACSKFRGATNGAGTPSSCYKCGEEGHFARECSSSAKACSRLRVETTGAGTPSSCYKCGEEGHFARECTSSAKACSRLRVETTGAGTPSSCYKCGEEGHFARECSSFAKVGKRNRELSNTKTSRFHKENDYMGYRSASHDIGKARKKKKPLTEERGIASPQKPKHRGGWMTEHPGEFSPMKSKRNGWRSPVTPSIKSTKIHSFSSGSHASSSKSSKMWKGHGETPKSHGSAKAFHHRFSASRFGNSSDDGLGRSYNWW